MRRKGHMFYGHRKETDMKVWIKVGGRSGGEVGKELITIHIV